MKKSSRVCTQERTRDWQVAIGGTCVKHAGELKGHANCCTIGQSFQAGQAVCSQLKLVSCSSRKAESPEHLVY